MISILSRIIGIALIGAALVAAVIDGTKSIAGSQLTITTLGQTWFGLSRTSLTAFQGLVRQNVEPFLGGWLWDPVVQGFLSLPTWAAAGLVGALLIWASEPGYRRRRRRLATG
jgi:hypothetical protein